MSEKVSIILLTCGLPKVSATCLGHLYEHTQYRPYELVWVDNGSQDMERAAVRAGLTLFEEPVVEVMLDKNEGWVGGCLAGLAAADPSSAYVALLNNDTRPDEGWLAALVRALQAHPHMGIVGSMSQNARQWQGIPMLRGRWPELKAAPVEPGTIGPWLREHRAGVVKKVRGMVAFFSVLIRREMVDQVGFLDPRFGLGLADDDDYCARALDAGWEVGVALDSFVEHDHRTTFNHLDELGEIDLEALQRQNLNLFREKRRQAAARGAAPGAVLRYLGRNGSPFVMNIPARDLTLADLARLELDLGIDRAEVVKTGLYAEVVDGTGLLGPGPFCGARLLLGERCREPVEKWGDRCSLHREAKERRAIPLRAIAGIGPEMESALARLEIADAYALATLGDRALVELAEDLPRVSEKRLYEWRQAARKLVGGNDDT